MITKETVFSCLLSAVLAFVACAGPESEPVAKAEPVASSQQIGCLVYQRPRAKWVYSGGHQLHRDGGAGASGRNFSWRGSWTTGDPGSSVVVIKIRDKTSDPYPRVLTHRYVIRDADEPTDPFEPHGFTGRVDTFLKSGYGVRYFCTRE